MADINKATPDPERGLIERDAKGEPNGVIRERSDLYWRLGEILCIMPDSVRRVSVAKTRSPWEFSVVKERSNNVTRARTC